MGRKYNHRPASRYLSVVDNLNNIMADAKVPVVVVKELVGVEYITMVKYLKKERNIGNEEVVKRMIVVTDLLRSMYKKGILPIPDETNARLRSAYILELVNKFLDK